MVLYLYFNYKVFTISYLKALLGVFAYLQINLQRALYKLLLDHKFSQAKGKWFVFLNLHQLCPQRKCISKSGILRCLVKWKKNYIM